MKKIISILLLATFCIFTQLHAQNRADELMKQAQENLTKKEYIKARYLFLQAYNAFATQDKYAQAVECGVNASALYHRENYYKEAFELLRGAEQVVATGEQKTGKAMPNLRFRINKERLHQPEKSRTRKGTADQTGRDRQSLSQRLSEQRPALYAGQLLLHLRYECAR